MDLDPDNYIAKLKRGWCLDRLGFVAKAGQDYDETVTMHPTCSEALIYRGYWFLEQNKLSEALEDLNKAIALNGDDARSYLGRARARELKEDYQNALSDLAMAVNIDPKIALQSSLRSGAIDEKLGKYEAAIANYSDALHLVPESKVFLERALCYSKTGDVEKAVKDCDDAIALQPENQVAYIRRAQYNTDLGRVVSAQQDLARALELNPSSYEAYFSRATLFLSQHEYEKAEADFTRPSKFSPIP